MRRAFEAQFFFGPMKWIVKLALGNGRVLFTSRPHPEDFQHEFKMFLTLHINAKESDIQLFVESGLQDDGRLGIKGQHHVCQNIVQNSGGSFRLAKIHLDKILWEASSPNMEQCSESLSASPNPAFREMIQKINEQSQGNQRRAFETLEWLVRSIRPLTPPEIVEALAVLLGEKTLNENKKLLIPKVLLPDTCEGFVEIDPQTNEVRFALPCTKEFLLDEQLVSPTLDPKLGRICVTYLLFREFAIPLKDYEAVREERPFLSYAAGAWAQHFCRPDNEEDTQLAVRFVKENPENLALAWQVYWRKWRNSHWSQHLLIR